MLNLSLGCLLFFVIENSENLALQHFIFPRLQLLILAYVALCVFLALSCFRFVRFLVITNDTF